MSGEEILEEAGRQAALLRDRRFVPGDSDDSLQEFIQRRRVWLSQLGVK